MRITDCFMDIFAYVTFLNQGPQSASLSFEKVKDDIDELLKKSQECALSQGVNQEDYELSRFAICAWIDEKILSSTLPFKEEWQRQQLQRRLYNTTNAGEEFFEKMNDLGPHQLGVREVYYICLCLGFVGRFCNPGDEYLLEQVKASNLKVLTGSSTKPPALEDERLFPRAYPSKVSMTGARRKIGLLSPQVITALVSPVALLGALYLVYHFILENLGESILKNM